MRKVYKQLTEEQKSRGVIFSSCLKGAPMYMMNDMVHEVFEDSHDRDGMIRRLKDDKVFNGSPWKYNEIRQ